MTRREWWFDSGRYPDGLNAFWRITAVIGGTAFWTVVVFILGEYPQ